jgi:signal transduction histidine kinase
MRLKTWPVAGFGFVSLLLLITYSMTASSRKAQEIYTQLDQLNTRYDNVDTKLRSLRSDVNLSGIFVRDYLLDIARERAPDYRLRIGEFRRANMATVSELKALIEGHDDEILALHAKLDDYWQTFDPLFDWTPAEKILRSASFLRQEVVPRREAVLNIAQQIEELNNANVAEQRAEAMRRHAVFRDDLRRLLSRTLLLGLLVAVTVVVRLRVLESRGDDQRTAAEEAERQMREISQRLVATQEEERKNLSRELHDHVGQVLTALRMELGRIERTKPPSEGRTAAAVAECRRLVDSMVRTVRDLALGLRPSMLDDFGLQPALEWHVRDFTRRYGVDVELQMSGSFDTLPEAYRTCVYRAVQEALTNCIRHANAQSIQVSIAGENERLDVSVSDDGVGLAAAGRGGGLGLRGIEERVRELGGVMTIDSAPTGGTTLAIRLQLPASPLEATLARAAG